MSSLTNHAETQVIRALLRGTNLTAPTTLYLALHTGDPGETGASNEVATGGYVRKAITFAADSDGACASSGAVSWTASGANFGTVSHASIWDAESGGNCWMKGAMGASKTVDDGDSINFAAGAVTGAVA